MNNNRLLVNISGNVFVNPSSLIGARVYDTSFDGKRFGVGQIWSCSGSYVTVSYENLKFQVNQEIVNPTVVSGGGYPEEPSGFIRLDTYTPLGVSAPFQNADYIPEAHGFTPHDLRIRRTRVVFSGEVNYELPTISGTVTSGNLPATQLILI